MSENQNKSPFIAYDVTSIPTFARDGKMITLPEIIALKEESGYLFYDSRKGKKPEVLNGDMVIKIVDYKYPEWKTKLKMLVRGINKKSLLKRLKG
jgi:hypothetical protein